jgi:NodT family efflux transporter outer membrane factor (OMF) lipoprotein
MKASSRVYVLGAAALLGGCTVGPNYTPPRTKVADTFSEAKAKDEAVAPESRIVPGVDAVQRWWLTFQDPELESLIKRAVQGNRDLIIAASRVRQARAARLEAGASLLPNVNLDGGYNRGHGSRNVTLPLGGSSAPSGGSSGESTAQSLRNFTSSSSSDQSRTRADSSAGGGGGGATSANGAGGGAGGASGGGAPLGPQSPFGNGGLPGVTTELFQAGFDASWEVDIFGGTRREIQYANAEVQVAEEAERAVLVSLMGEVATTYIQLRTTQHRLQIARENLQAQREILSISEAKFKAGFQTELDVARQTAEVATTESTIPAQESSERTLIHSLAFTIGVESDALSEELGAVAPLPKIPLEVPVGMPSDILRRRADVREAERQLAAANAMVGVATASLFPRFSLTGSAGLDSSKFADLPRWSSHYYSIIPGVSWPILDWGKVKANITVQNEAQKQAFTAYESTVAQALRDVEDALVRYRTEQVRRASLENAVKAANNAFTIARQQFQHGLADSTVVLDAQRSLLSSQDQLAESEGAIRADLVSLYKALGGGWDA